jgi:hypothetical protein
MDPRTYKPVYNESSMDDINTINNGELENMRHQAYQNLIKVNPKQLRK